MTADKPRLPVGMVWLVGAGPGDPGLITVAGLEAVRQADVIVYDRLVSPRLLEHPDLVGAELIYMGKVAGEGHHDQSKINDLLIEKARQGKRVVRPGEERTRSAVETRYRDIYYGLSLVAEPAYIDRIAGEVGADRLIFGSNAAGGGPRIGLMVFEYTRLTEEEKKLATGKNLARLLGL
ncbi:hypothetical protein LCGC14_2666460 [marine sediment metagenome]|uniref:Tetrapyrrole methylase domain-containing protein n=1 Tax=marine sediment metagenome TaxID=412755 RepID=A0A0F9CHA3_9ZZZZ